MAESATITKTFQFRLLPNRKQCKELEYILYLTRTLYNAALQERKEAHKNCRKSISFYDQQKSLTEIRKDDERIAAINRRPFQSALTRLDNAFKGFFKRSKEGKRGKKAGYPRFKGAARWDSIGFDMPNAFKISEGDKWRRLSFKGVTGGIKLYLHREMVGKVLTASIKRDYKGWYVNITCESPAPAPSRDERVVGIDVGIERFLTQSDGEFMPNPRFLEKQLKALRVAQRAASCTKKDKRGNLNGKVRGSGNHKRAKAAVTRMHAKVKNARKDYHWNAIAALLANAGIIAVEDLNIKGLSSGRLARQVNDVAWGDFITKLKYKAAEAGKRVVEVKPHGTSQECSGCGKVVRKSLDKRKHQCECGVELHRDHNAAINILMRAVASPLPHKVAPLPSAKKRVDKGMLAAQASG